MRRAHAYKEPERFELVFVKAALSRRPWGRGIVHTTFIILIMLAAAIVVVGIVLYERGRWH